MSVILLLSGLARISPVAAHQNIPKILLVLSIEHIVY
jgi:hypothetical protein